MIFQCNTSYEFAIEIYFTKIFNIGEPRYGKLAINYWANHENFICTAMPVIDSNSKNLDP